MESKFFVVEVNEGIYLERNIMLGEGWFPTYDINEAYQFMSRDKAYAIAFKWGGKVLGCTVEIRTYEEDE
ncbi:hypothetical protein [Staphylococcus agnetis]|uniref:hypothetical protein n=1 Tax=Staphylococcus agnetis TaxID=985762 RepID=UPI000D1B7FD9|nr:hypothetical protein [Staphylococcus agnetis]PTH57671.1 hypothetical protein BU584_07875 [Staphylococcus agnetis]